MLRIGVEPSPVSAGRVSALIKFKKKKTHRLKCVDKLILRRRLDEKSVHFLHTAYILHTFFCCNKSSLLKDRYSR